MTKNGYGFEVERCQYAGCLGPADGSECRHPGPDEDLCDPEPAYLTRARDRYLASGDPDAAAVIARTER
jgi:hypothetical protein